MTLANGTTRKKHGLILRALQFPSDYISPADTRAHDYYYNNTVQKLNQLNEVLKGCQKNDVNLLLARALVYMNMKSYNQAAADIDIVLSMEPNNYHAYAIRGHFFLKMEQYTEAIDCLEFSIENVSDDFYAYEVRGELYYVLGQHEIALADLNKSLELLPRQTFKKEKQSRPRISM
jgi:tetratricopeptide (TPR) repeat protein